LCPTPGDFEPLHGQPFQAGAETVLGLLRKGVPGPAMQSRFYVAINEPGTIQRRSVLATLIYLAEAANYARRLRQKGARIEQHRQGDGEYRTTLESLISAAGRPHCRLWRLHLDLFY
jgi:hypothetical protein